MINSSVSQQEINRQIAAEKRIVAHSTYQFLLGHCGLRPDRLHGLAATSGSGKSSLCKAIVAQTSETQKVLIWLSEESVTDYQMKMMNYINNWDNIKFFRERDLPEEVRHDQKKLFSAFTNIAVSMGANFVFIDNLTSSRFYSDDLGPRGQAISADFLAAFPAENNIGIFYLIHTGRHVTDNFHRLIEKEDVRGSSIIQMRTEYFYILQKFTYDGKIYTFIRDVKFRHHEAADGFYALYYDNGKYLKDEKIDFNKINDVFKLRDRLGRK